MGKKLLTDRIKTFIHKYWIILFILGTGVYFVSCVVINFIGKPWYNIDMYSDALVAELMADEMTLFPSSWTFGNQYYVVATPVLGAVFYKFIGDSFYAMALASSVMMAVIYLSYWWCLKLFVSKKVLLIGLFTLSGGFIFGTSASCYEFGFQVFYTMASYYACYIIGIFFTIGLFFRIYQDIYVNKICFIAVAFLNFALGMQSLRETLILNIPLIISALYLLIRKTQNGKKVMFFSLAMAASNLLGIVFIHILEKFVPIKVHKIIDDLRIHTFDEIISVCIPKEKENLLKITGLNLNGLIQYDKTFLFVSIGVFISVFCVIVAIVAIILRKDKSLLALAVICNFISVLLVFTLGVFFFRNRPIYYFVWCLLTSFSLCYCINLLKRKKIIISIVCFCVFIAGIMNYYNNFYIDFKVNYKEKDEFYSELSEEILADGVQYVYLYDWDSAYPLYCYHKNRIKIGTFTISEKSGFVQPLPYLKCDNFFDEKNREKSYFIFSRATLTNLENTENFQVLLSKLKVVKEKNYQGNRFLESVRIYKAESDVIYRENTNT